MPDRTPLTLDQRQLVERAEFAWREDLAGKVAVITGGARGIGRTIGEALTRVGARVVAADLNWTGADDYRHALESAGGAALTLDVAEEEQVAAACAKVLDQFATVDILINNAALISETLYPPRGRRPVLETTLADWERMYRVNVAGVLAVTQNFIKPMMQRGSGSIVNVVSSGILQVATGGGYHAARPWTVEMPYQATKAAVATMAFYLAEEVMGDGVSVNSVMPGHTRASWFDGTARAYGELGAVYGRRPVVAEHLLPLVLFLATQDAQHGVSGRLYSAPEWNFDHGYGHHAVWLDRSLPPDMEAAYAELDAAAPDIQRSGVPHPSFEAGMVMYAAAMEQRAAVADANERPQ